MTPRQRAASIAGKASASNLSSEERKAKATAASLSYWRCKLITIDGESLTLHAWCKRKGLNYQTIISRMHRGMRPEEAITTPVVARKRITLFTANGKTMDIDDWAARAGITRRRILDRLRNGCTPEQAVRPDRAYYRGPMVGDKTLRQAARDNGVNRLTARSRVYAGMSPEEAVNPEVDRARDSRGKINMICVNADWAGKRSETAVKGVFRVCPVCGGRVVVDEAVKR